VAVAATGTGQDEWTGFEGNCGGDWTDALGNRDDVAGYVIEPTICNQERYTTIKGTGDTFDIINNNKVTLQTGKDWWGGHTHEITASTDAYGNTDLKTVLPPYLVVYRWRRTN
jgi:hypothetical protein